ncbi:MAG TPA: DUF1549 domain-containing protein [Planctomycetota bacterium]|nr:DUF1549 domain-containing protein [Planctomycetota bacterium]
MALAAVLSLLQDDPPSISASIDSTVRSIPGYDLAKEPKPIGDEAFLRRLLKDLVDAAPTDEEVTHFAEDRDPQKRSKKVTQLVADERFAAFWAKRFEGVFFVDVLRNPWTELSMLTTGQRGKLVEAFTAWMATRLRADKPWTDIVAQMLDARGTPDGDPAMGYLLSFRRGKGFEREFAENMPRHLLGIRLACARCHDDPYDRWTLEDYYGMAAFVVRQRAGPGRFGLELKYADEGDMKLDSGGLRTTFGPQEGKEMPPKFLYGGTAGKNDDRMKVLLGLMTNRSTTQLPRMLVNRVWSWLFGAGIVQPVDDFTSKNPSVSPALLEALVKSTVDHRYSVQHLVRVLCATQAYQLPTPAEAPDGESFRHLASRKLASRAHAPLSSSPPALPVKVEFPGEWTRVKEGGAAKALFLIPQKGNPGRSAELWLAAGVLEKGQWLAKTGLIDPVKTTVTPIEGKGKLKIRFTEQAGPNWCQATSDGPLDFRFWLAELEGPKPLHFRVGAPADLLDPWRDDFVACLRSLSLK